MQPKNNNNDFVLYNESQGMIPFMGSFYLFLFKKTEKIVLALYLVTDHLSDSDSIKNSVRKIANLILRDSVAMTTKPHTDMEYKTLLGHVSEVTSLLDIASSLKMISPKNTTLIKDELARLLGDIQEQDVSGQNRTLLKKSFFVVDTNTATNVFYKGHKRQSQKEVSFKTNTSTIDTDKEKNKQHIKDNRTEKIINLAKEKGSFSVKDASELFVGISEKTIQRELLKLVATGVLKKEGERRWSTYSLL